jgi:hypothetical protein
MNLDRYKDQKEAYTDEVLLDFVKEMSKTLSRNWKINSKFDRSIFDTMYDKYNVKYVEHYPGTPKNDMEELIYLVLNYGYVVGDNKRKLLPVDHTTNFVKSMIAITEVIDVSEISKDKLTYNGPDITSCSVTACSYDISGTLKNIGRCTKGIKEEMPKYKHPRFVVMLGLVYNYGYGYGNDVSFYDNMFKVSKLSKFFKK